MTLDEFLECFRQSAEEEKDNGQWIYVGNRLLRFLSEDGSFDCPLCFVANQSNKHTHFINTHYPAAGKFLGLSKADVNTIVSAADSALYGEKEQIKQSADLRERLENIVQLNRD